MADRFKVLRHGDKLPSPVSDQERRARQGGLANKQAVGNEGLTAESYIRGAEALERQAAKYPGESRRLLSQARLMRQKAKSAIGGRQDTPVGYKSAIEDRPTPAAQPHGRVYRHGD